MFGVYTHAAYVQPRHAGSNDVNRKAELDRPSRVACSDLGHGSALTIIYNEAITAAFALRSSRAESGARRK